MGRRLLHTGGGAVGTASRKPTALLSALHSDSGLPVDNIAILCNLHVHIWYLVRRRELGVPSWQAVKHIPRAGILQTVL
jgi:hypothetical protein